MMSRTIKIIFTISLVLNLVLVGVFIGGALKHKKHHKIPQNISESGKKTLQDNMGQVRQNMRQNFKTMRAQRDSLRAILEAEEFDRSAYNKTIETILNVKDKAARARASKMGDTLSQLSQEDRQKMSKEFMRKLGGKSKKHHAKHGSRKRFNESNGVK